MNKRATIIPALSLTVIIILIICSLFTTNAQNQPKAWYVDKNATGSNNGTSWANAWTSFSSINWSSLNNGDTIYISGGNNTTVYSEKLTVSRSNVVISSSNDLGHNGVPLISGEGIEISYQDNVVIYGLSIGATVTRAIYVNRGNNITIDNVNILTDAWGVYIQYSTDVTVRNCIIKTVEFSTKQTDGIYSQYNRRIKIHNNYIEVKNSEANGHDDCIQSYQDGVSSSNTNENTMTVWNNILYQNNTKLSNSSATMMTYGWGWFTFYNNLVLQPFSYTVGLGVQQNVTPGASNMKCRIWNNTIIAGVDHDKPIYFRRMDVSDTIDVVNNILYNAYLNQKVKIDDSPNFNIKRWDYNAYFSTNPSWTRLLLLNGTPLTIPAWISMGYDSSSLFVDPNFVNPYVGLDSIGDFSLSQNSPLINQGLDIEQEVIQLGLAWEDINGVPRGSAPTIGAFELIDTTPPEIVSANIIDSITVNISFSEPIEQISATNPANYSIDNGILVNSVQVLSSSNIKLNTSGHSPGFYTVTVSNVTDTAGNVISAQNNSALYGYNPDPLPGLLKFTPTGSNASSIPEPEHIPEKTFDGLGYNSGDPSSRWAAQGLPQWIVYDLGDVKIVNKTRIQFFRWLEGRIYTYSILTSVDSINWVVAEQNVQSGTVEWNEVNFEPVPGRYVKILVTGNNENDWANIWETEIYGNILVSGNDDDNKVILSEFKLEQNYPNPFNPTTKIRFVIPKKVRNLRDFSLQAPRNDNALVSLKVYDILGNEVATLVEENKTPGVYEVEFDANNLSSGVYLYRLQVNDFIEVKKMILMR